VPEGLESPLALSTQVARDPAVIDAGERLVIGVGDHRLVAAPIALIGFLIVTLLRERPLRGTTAAAQKQPSQRPAPSHA
jgi:hypothetical protein